MIDVISRRPIIADQAGDVGEPGGDRLGCSVGHDGVDQPITAGLGHVFAGEAVRAGKPERQAVIEAQAALATLLPFKAG